MLAQKFPLRSGENQCITLTVAGMINGLDYVISSAHRTVGLALKEEWQNMLRANLLFTQWDAPSFIDVLMFCMLCCEVSKRQQQEALEVWHHQEPEDCLAILHEQCIALLHLECLCQIP